MISLVGEKVKQAAGILSEVGIDLWLTFVRETSAGGDPVLPLIYGDADLTWQSALILTPAEEPVAIVGRFEVEAARATGAYPVVVSYDESIRPELLRAIERIDPARIAVNYSENDVLADGLGHGLYKVLVGYLEGTPYAGRLEPAEGIISRLRGRKTRGEVARIAGAIETTRQIYDDMFNRIRPGMTEIEIGDWMLAQVSQRGLEPAWHEGHCPTVNAGPASPVGHVGRTEQKVARGELVHFDFGVKQKGYCSDVQRVVYMLAAGERGAPEPVQRAFDTVVGAIQAAAKVLKPGVSGWQVDEAARKVVIEAGYPEYKHATGHQLGRLAHDGGALLGPRWPRYGNTPHLPVEVGQVYTLELGVDVAGYGYVGLEEDVLVTEGGADFLTEPQTEPILR
ncbi:MAG: aminopeptidase P family protein [Anaerolineae bacterium]|nr:aminopeptidase P family protein [Anaerolineae bacterium]